MSPKSWCGKKFNKERDKIEKKLKLFLNKASNTARNDNFHIVTKSGVSYPDFCGVSTYIARRHVSVSSHSPIHNPHRHSPVLAVPSAIYRLHMSLTVTSTTSPRMPLRTLINHQLNVPRRDLRRACRRPCFPPAHLPACRSSRHYMCLRSPPPLRPAHPHTLRLCAPEPTPHSPCCKPKTMGGERTREGERDMRERKRTMRINKGTTWRNCGLCMYFDY
jgi:hypothetical protein